jgi:hypothetical protein
MSIIASKNDPITVVNPAFKVECVIVCDKYNDFLAQTLPHNKHIFDRLVVVTSAEDAATQRICEYHHVECIKTDAIRSRWKEFCKGCGVNEGLSKLSKDGWVVHMDADIALPPLTKQILQNANLDPSMIYGIDRFIVKGYKAWDDFRSQPMLQHEDNTYIHVHAFPIGTRFMQQHVGGYVPIGFFQLWHPGVSQVSEYPQGHTGAGREDTLHAQKWPRAKRGFIPELVGYHLESDDSEFSVNWEGRKTKPFQHK